MEMMAVIDIRRKYEAYTKHQVDEYHRQKRAKANARGAKVKAGR